MSNVVSFVISVCSSMVIGGIVCLIGPSDNLRSLIKVVTAIFIIGVCISPVVNFDRLKFFDKFDISNEYGVNTDLQEYITNEISNETQKQIAVKLGEILSARGVNEYSVKFEVNNNYEIVSINIYTKDQNDGLEEYLEASLGINVNIIEE